MGELYNSLLDAFEEIGIKENNQRLIDKARKYKSISLEEEIGDNIKSYDKEFLDKYNPIIDINNKSRFKTKVVGKRHFAYDKEEALLHWIFQDEEEKEALGKDCPWRSLDAQGLSYDNWKESPEYWCDIYNQEIDEETAYALDDIKSEFGYDTEYVKPEKQSRRVVGKNGSLADFDPQDLMNKVATKGISMNTDRDYNNIRYFISIHYDEIFGEPGINNPDELYYVDIVSEDENKHQERLTTYDEWSNLKAPEVVDKLNAWKQSIIGKNENLREDHVLSGGFDYDLGDGVHEAHFQDYDSYTDWYQDNKDRIEELPLENGDDGWDIVRYRYKKDESLTETLSLDKVVPDALEQMRSRGVENITVDDIAEEIAYEYPGYEDWQDIIANYDDLDAIRRFKDIKAAIVHELPSDFTESLKEAKLNETKENTIDDGAQVISPEKLLSFIGELIHDNIVENYTEEEIEKIEELKKKYPNLVIPKRNPKNGKPILPYKIAKGWD